MHYNNYYYNNTYAKCTIDWLIDLLIDWLIDWPWNFTIPFFWGGGGGEYKNTP